ncbi:ABC transporter ATP-binding protein [Pseudomaricurvus sp.]|uniref:ABC transporter ATP-binding protein n=1 Tax=Pseudomaricurvus sp. TaxID=2004510 RepID=UPI003F6CB429
MNSNKPREMTKNSATPLLQVKDLSVAFRQDNAITEVVQHVSFTVHPGETVDLVGESGSGKSMTAHAIMKLLPYPMAFHPSGEVIFDDLDLIQLSDKRMQAIRGNKIGMIFQEPMTALNPLHTIDKQIGEVICQHRGINLKQARPFIVNLLHKVQIPNPETRLKSYPHELSGGQRQRVMIAMALANEPRLLIADEPTTALDVTVQKEILQLLKKLQQEENLGFLLITHDLGVVKHMAQQVLVMKNGEIVEKNSTQDIFKAPSHKYTKQLLLSKPAGKPAEVATSAEENSTLLSTKQLNVSFTTRKSLFGKPIEQFRAVKEASLAIQKGTTLGVVGESGSGKSTLALAILRLIESDGGILFNNTLISDIPEKKLRSLRKDFQIVFQDPFASLSPRMTAEEIIQEGLNIHNPSSDTANRLLSQEQKQERVKSVMHEVGLDSDLRHRYPHEFSGGQRQRIAIARALILNPSLLILDEPTSALDKTVQVQVVDLLRDLQQRRQLTYLFISHDLSVVKALSHQIVVMKDGEIVEQGDASTLLSQPKQAYTQHLLAATLS